MAGARCASRPGGGVRGRGAVEASAVAAALAEVPLPRPTVPGSRAARRAAAGAGVRGAGGAVGRRLLRGGAPAVGCAEGVGVGGA